MADFRRSLAPASSPVVQMKKKNAEAYNKANNLGLAAITKATVEGYVNDEVNDAEHRLGLLVEWNSRQLKANMIECPDNLVAVVSSSVPLELDPDAPPVKRADSPIFGRHKHYVHLPENALTVDIFTLQGTSQSVPRVKSFPQAILLIRGSMDPADQSKREGRSGQPFFILELGPYKGLFSYTAQGQDIVFGLLKEKGEGADKKLMRKGSDKESWQGIAQKLRQLNREGASIRDELVNVLNGKITPSSEAIFLAAGAMACDFRLSISGAISFVEDLLNAPEPTIETTFTDKDPIWGPASKRRGRKKKIM